jgi:hypothetical protein
MGTSVDDQYGTSLEVIQTMDNIFWVFGPELSGFDNCCGPLIADPRVVALAYLITLKVAQLQYNRENFHIAACKLCGALL